MHSSLKSLLFLRTHTRTRARTPTLHLYAGVFCRSLLRLNTTLCLSNRDLSRSRAESTTILLRLTTNLLPPPPPFSLFFFSCALRDWGRVRRVGMVQWWGGRVDVDFSSLLCESQGMVTINILYSLKPSKNTILERGWRWWWWRRRRWRGCAHFLAVPPQCIQAGRVMPGAAHIYIFINTGLYNETGLRQEQHVLLVQGSGA